MMIFASAAVVIPMLYPAAPLIPMLILFQMFGGLAVMTTWIGAQSLTGSLMRGQPVYTGRLTLATRIGTIFGPPTVGAIWDVAGAWWAFSFLSLWAVLTVVSTFFVPETAKPKVAADAPPKTATTIRDIMPKLSDYLDAFRLVAIPAIGLVFMVTILRHSGVAMQSNFYVIYLDGIGISGTMIGILFSVLGAVGGVGAISTGWLATKFSNRRILLSSIALGVFMMTITPIIGWTGFTMEVAPVAAIFDFLGLDIRSCAGCRCTGALFLIRDCHRDSRRDLGCRAGDGNIHHCPGGWCGTGQRGGVAGNGRPVGRGVPADPDGSDCEGLRLGGIVLYCRWRDSCGARLARDPGFRRTGKPERLV